MEIRLLGNLEVIGASGELVAISGTKLRTLLAVLALDAGKVVGTDRLVDCIWGAHLPLKVDNALQVLVSKLRHALHPAGEGRPVIVNRAPGYLLDVDADDVDALAVVGLVAEGRAQLEPGAAGDPTELLRRALALWRGPVLADFAYDDFAAGERARLEELRLSVAEDCIESDLTLGRHGRCVGELEQLVADHPLRERFWSQLMVALYRSGRQADALRVFQDARTHLGDELGIEPGPELRRIEAAILAQDPALDAPGRADVPPHPEGPTAVAVSEPGNLARPLTECLGRQDELAELHRLLRSHRLVTIVGPGGAGKTRLAVEAALTGDRPRGGAWLVELAPVADAGGVLPAVRCAVGGPPDATSGEDLAASLDHRDVLIVLDNCEHLIDEAARLASDLVTGAPRLRLLATSREALGVPGEMVYPVPPLRPAAAARLFAERATAAAPAIEFDEPSTVAVMDICARLDGLPLAIELAASRARALDVTQIAARLSDRFRLLTVGARTALPRHRTLRAVVDWSYDLLGPDERRLFERLSVFAGGGTMEALEAVCAGDGIEPADVADVVSRLIDKSLVSRAPGTAGPRYSMLQTLVEYSGERLRESGQADTYRRRHAEWILEVSRQAERIAGRLPTVGLTELAAEADNVDAALVWANGVDPAVAFELACRMGWFWFWTGRVDVGWRAIAACLAHSEADVPPGLRARAWTWLGMYGRVMQAPDALEKVERGVAEARACGDRVALGAALGARAALAIVHGQAARALRDLDEADACFAGTGDRHAHGMVWRLRGAAAMTAGRFEEAAGAYARSIEELRASGDEWAVGLVFRRVAELAERQGRFDDAADALEEAVARVSDVPNRFAQALVLTQLASVRMGQGRLEEAAAIADDAVGRGQASAHAPATVQAIHVRGRIALRRKRLQEAEADLRQALQRYRSQGYLGWAAACTSDLGRIAAGRGDTVEAVELHSQAAAVAAGTEDRMVMLSTLEGLALALAVAGDGERAGRLIGAADALRDAGARPWDPNVDERDAAVAATIELVGGDALAGLRRAGRAAPLSSLLDGVSD